MSKPVRISLLVVALLALLVLSFAVAIPAIRTYHMEMRRVRCGVNAMYVAQQLQSNATLIDWDAPDPIGQLVALKLIDANHARCPGGLHTYQVNTTAILTPLGKMTNPTTTVILYEPLENHEGLGGMVMFADGHGQWVSAADMPRVLKNGSAH